MNGQPLAYLDREGNTWVVITQHNGVKSRKVITEMHATLIKDVIEQHPDWGLYEAYQYTCTEEFRDKLLGNLINRTKTALLKDLPEYCN